MDYPGVPHEAQVTTEDREFFAIVGQEFGGYEPGRVMYDPNLRRPDQDFGLNVGTAYNLLTEMGVPLDISQRMAIVVSDRFPDTAIETPKEGGPSILHVRPDSAKSVTRALAREAMRIREERGSDSTPPAVERQTTRTFRTVLGAGKAAITGTGGDI